MKTKEEIVDELFLKDTGFIDATVVSWKNVAKPLCMKCLEEGYTQAQKDFEKLIDDLPINIQKDYANGKQYTFIELECLKAKLKQMEKEKHENNM